MTSVIDGLVSADSVLGEIPLRVTGHSGPTRNVSGAQPLDHPLTSVEEMFVVHAETIRNSDIESFVSTLVDLAMRYRESLGEVFVQTLIDVTDAVGNTVDAQGLPFSWDFFLDALEKIEVSFDDEGKAHGQRVLVNPKTAELLRTVQITPKQRQRHDDIMRRKKEQWDAEKRSRRLPRRH